MLFMTARLSKKRLAAAALAAVALTAVLCLARCGGKEADEAETPLSTNADRVEYLRSWGWEVEAEPLETLQLLMPESLPESYRLYNAMQKEQGFDLERCLGKQITRYTYHALNYPGRPEGVQINLYVCENRPAAGDVIASGSGGFQAGLAFPEEPAKK